MGAGHILPIAGVPFLLQNDAVAREASPWATKPEPNQCMTACQSGKACAFTVAVLRCCSGYTQWHGCVNTSHSMLPHIYDYLQLQLHAFVVL